MLGQQVSQKHFVSGKQKNTFSHTQTIHKLLFGFHTTCFDLPTAGTHYSTASLISLFWVENCCSSLTVLKVQLCFCSKSYTWFMCIFSGNQQYEERTSILSANSGFTNPLLIALIIENMVIYNIWFAFLFTVLQCWLSDSWPADSAKVWLMWTTQ